MTRKTIDCRTVPSDVNCTLTISGEEDEVLSAAAQHASTVHGHAGEIGLQDALREALTDAAGVSNPGAFVQLVEFSTDRVEEWDAIQDRAIEGVGAGMATRWSVLGADRDRPGRYVAVVEFPSHDRAMANSAHPAINAFAEELAKICTEGPVFRNLDVRRALEH